MEITFAEAVEVFVRGFSFTRSFTHPYLVERIHDCVWWMRDAPRTSGDYRTEEYIGYALAPETLHALAQDHARGRYRLCMIRRRDESDHVLRQEFKALKYRLMTTEAFMVHDLKQIEPVAEPVSIVRVTSQAEAEALAKAARSRQILPQYLDREPAPMRQYAAKEAEKFVGWVGSVAVAECGWCTSMYVVPEYRRRGIARALMTRMLQEDRKAGFKANVLLSSHTGSKLYPTVGYDALGELLMFTPPK